MSEQLYNTERVLTAEIAKEIRWTASHTDFDHRKFICREWLEAKAIHNSVVEVPQGRLIYAIGKILHPVNVFEVGVGPGITAHSLISSCPHMNYFGVDNMASEFHRIAVSITLDNIGRRLISSGGTAGFRCIDSDNLNEFEHPNGPIDLIHIDGDHSYDHQRRDVEKAIRSGAEWLLVDDCNDTEVVTACFHAWRNEWNKSWRGGLLPMVYFEDSRTGSFLFHSGMWKHLTA